MPAGILTAPTITIYVRHSAGCKYEGDEFAKKCPCRKWLRWTPNDGSPRQRIPAKTRSWAEAEQVKLELANQLAGKPVTQDETADQTLRRAVEVFLADKGQSIGADVLGKYTRELDRLVEFCERKRVYNVSGLTRELLVGYAETWTAQYPSTQTRSVVRTRCGGFLRFCFDARWLARVPKLPKVAIDVVPTMPLTEEEYARLLAAADAFKGPETPAKVRALVQLMRWSGLAITDALTLPRQGLYEHGGLFRVTTQRTKTGTHVSVALPPDVAREILATADERYIFWDGSSDITKSWTKYVIAPLFAAAAIEKVGNTVSHRLRDTFAVDVLTKGVPLEDVSKLLGHNSIKTTERSYAKWVKARQDRLDALVVATWAPEPEKTQPATCPHCGLALAA